MKSLWPISLRQIKFTGYSKLLLFILGFFANTCTKCRYDGCRKAHYYALYHQPQLDLLLTT